MAQFIEQRLRLFQVGGIETFGKPIINFLKHRVRLLATALLYEQLRQRNGGSQLVRFRFLLPRKFERGSKALLRLSESYVFH